MTKLGKQKEDFGNAEVSFCFLYCYFLFYSFILLYFDILSHFVFI